MTCRGLSMTLALATMGCQRTAELQCYPVDPHSPVVWSELEDPLRFVTDGLVAGLFQQR